MSITICIAEPKHWDDIRAVFGTKGDAAWCFCQYFVDPEWNRGKDTNQKSLRDQLGTFTPASGLLAFEDDVPVGWVQVGPSSRFSRFSPKGHLPEDGVWAITCFVVHAEHRGTGVATELLKGAVAHASSHGAALLRARPTDTSMIEKKSTDLFSGILSTFDRAGFAHVNRNRSRVLVELALTD